MSEIKRFNGRIIFSLSLFFSVIFISSCQNDNNNNQQKQEHVWKNQTDTMEKAKAVEGILEESSQELRQHIQDETE